MSSDSSKKRNGDDPLRDRGADAGAGAGGGDDPIRHRGLHIRVADDSIRDRGLHIRVAKKPRFTSEYRVSRYERHAADVAHRRTRARDELFAKVAAEMGAKIKADAQEETADGDNNDGDNNDVNA